MYTVVLQPNCFYFVLIYRPGSSLGVITNFTTDWINGYAFMFIVHTLKPELVNLEEDLSDDNKKNLDKAFTLLEEHLNVPRLLEPSGMSD